MPSDDSVPAAPEVVENALLCGRVRLRQPARGYRAGMDEIRPDAPAFTGMAGTGNGADRAI